MGRVLYVYGAGGLGREVMELVTILNRQSHTWTQLLYADDDVSGIIEGTPVVGGRESLLGMTVASDVVLGIADPDVKSRLFRELSRNGLLAFPTLVHPDAYVSPSAGVGAGAIIQRGCSVSVAVTVGRFVFVNMGCRIGHDAQIGDFSSLMADVDLGGHDLIEESCYFGTKCTVVPGVRIGRGVRVGAASLVVHDIVDGLTVMGNPARDIDRRS
jgi:sugar O-acyltransferase (sialic acid O-acetyltransferase NeuD family)